MPLSSPQAAAVPTRSVDVEVDGPCANTASSSTTRARRSSRCRWRSSRSGRRSIARGYDVAIVDGRLEADPIARVCSRRPSGALCLGVSVLTGTPIRDALAVTALSVRRRPRCRIVWGGWHPSLFPERNAGRSGRRRGCRRAGRATRLRRSSIGASAGESLDGIAGCVTPGGIVVLRGRRRDINDFPEHDYGADRRRAAISR